MLQFEVKPFMSLSINERKRLYNVCLRYGSFREILNGSQYKEFKSFYENYIIILGKTFIPNGLIVAWSLIETPWIWHSPSLTSDENYRSDKVCRIQVYVLPAFRRKKIGSKLFEKAKEVAKEKDLLIDVTDWNHSSFEFFSKQLPKKFFLRKNPWQETGDPEADSPSILPQQGG